MTSDEHVTTPGRLRYTGHGQILRDARKSMPVFSVRVDLHARPTGELRPLCPGLAARCSLPVASARRWVEAGRNRWRHRGATPTMGVGVVYARSTTIQAQPSSIDAGIAQV